MFINRKFIYPSEMLLVIVCVLFLSFLFIYLSFVPPRGQRCRATGWCKRLCWTVLVLTLLLLHYHYLASTSSHHGGVRSEGDELSLKKPPYLPEARTMTPLAVPVKLRLHASQVKTTVNTWACEHGRTRGGTYNDLRGNGHTL